MIKRLSITSLLLFQTSVWGQIPAPLVANNGNDYNSDHHCIWYDKCGPDPGI